MNASLMQSWATLNEKFEALNKRERWLVFGGLVFLTYTLLNAALLDPVLARKKNIEIDLTAKQTQVQQLQQQLSILNSQGIVDPDAQNKERIAELQSDLQELKTQLNSMQSTLIRPEKMPELLHSLLKKNGKIALLELKTLALRPIIESTVLAENNTETVVTETTPPPPLKDATLPVATAFKHGVELTVEGRYLDLLEYVSELEKMPWHVLWSKAALEVDPQSQLSKLKLTVYTMSLDQTWLSI